MLKHNLELRRLARWALLALLGWSALVGYSLHATLRNEEDIALALARNTARANFFKDQAFRLWASEKGGLYAVVDEHTRPVSFLAHVPHRDIRADNGQALTLLNPASMLREMMDRYSGLYGIKGRIVGIVTLNPANKADAWEEKSIHAFERGEKEIVEVADMGGKPYLRLIRPMIMQTDCMKCHGHLGFKVGDVRGAVGISVPLTDYFAMARAQMGRSTLFHGSIWFIGLLGGGFFFRSQRHRLGELVQTEDALRESEAHYREAQRMAHLGHWSYDTDSRAFLWWSEETFRLLGLDPVAGHPDFDAFIGHVHPDDREHVGQVVERCLTDGQPFVVTYRVPLAAGGIRYLEARGNAHTDERGRVIRMSGTVMDITDRHLAEEHLLTFRALAEASVDAIVMAAPESALLTYANRAAHEMFGCDFQRQEMLGMPGSEFWPREDREMMEWVIGQGLTSGWVGDVRQMRRDGSVFDANATVFPIGGADGHPLRIVAIIRDVTDRKLSDEALKTANSKLEGIVDFLPDATFVVDACGCVIAWNRAMETMTGVAKAEILGRGDGRYAHAFYGERRPMLIDLVLNGGADGHVLYRSFERRGEVLVAEGETPEAYGGRGAYVWATALPLKDAEGHVIGAIECVRDITESKQAEAALKQNEERLRFALEGTSDGIWDWDLKTGQTYFSPRYYTMLGYAPGAFPANFESWRGLLHPDDLAGAEAAVQAHLEGEESHFATEFRCRTQDGDWRWVLGRGKVVEWDADGQPTRIAGSHTDISARKEVENRLKLTQFAVEHASDAVFWFDHAGRFSYVNEQASLLLGYSREELVRMSIPDVDLRRAADDIQPMVADLIQQGSLRLETELRHKDGGVVPVEISAKHISFGGQEHMVAHVRDVSGRKIAEDALRVEKHFSDALINSLPGVFYLFDADARLLRWNRNFLEITGYAEARLAGMLLTDFIAEEDRGFIAEKIREVYQSGSAVAEAQLITARGGKIPFYLTGLHMREGDRDYLIGTGIDITERRRVEEALRLIRFGVERSSDAFFLIDPESRFLDVNEAACVSLGYTKDELLTMSIMDIDLDVPAGALADIFNDLRGKGRLRIETSHRRRDGTAFPVEIMANYIEFGGREYNFCYARDISERKKAEAALHLTRRAIDVADMAFEWYDESGHIIDVNRQTCEELGYSREEMLRLRLCDIDPGFPAERWPEIWETIKRDGAINTESTHRRKDGSTFPVQITGNYVAFEGREYVFSYAQNITERRQAEEMLRLTQYAIDHASVAFEWLNLDGEVVASNIKAYESLGYTRDEFIGMNVLDFTPDASKENWRAHVEHLRRKGNDFIEAEHRRKDGSIFPIEVRANLVKFGDREFIFSYLNDISARKAAELALKQLNVSLEARVHEEVAKNRDKDHLLIQQSRLAAMGEMMGNIAHQWRQPINALSLVLANIRDAYEFNQLDRAYLDDQVGRGGHLIHKMSSTIDDFRNFFRPDRTRQSFSLARAVRDAMMIVELSYAHAKIALELESGEDVMCFGFPNEYAQVVLNLLGNAKDAILEREIPAGRVGIRIWRDGQAGGLTLSDNGGGIAEDVLPKVFEPYFTTRDKGTGIGLYMSRTIIENMGGHIEVANADGGVRVNLTTPLAESPSVATGR